MNYETLDVWKRSKQLSVAIYKELKNLRDYGFKDQITRSGLSIPCNIAEGFERGSQKECIAFLAVCQRFMRGIENPDSYRHGYWLYQPKDRSGMA